ncbi:probable glucan 1,4-alpha-glucosidase [Serendipita indica DSM 11827]|uniref:Glucoamylase n=1 Tax=Serendipita indica (strain DSM 11827) TaxID=1109443 RepID=G4TUZ2_SERID|nr:probable glucan 1,4-alpha-glucosidase [Serendipita indica DSM 11827]
MLFTSVFSCLLLLSPGGALARASPRENPFNKRVSYTNVADFDTFETPIALAGLYANIGPDGAKSQGAKAGVVIASPSTSDPDYLYTWTRDASLVFKYIVDRFTSGRDSSLRTKIDNFVGHVGRIQQVTNPSGTVSTGGLGEPKFMISEAAFTGEWGRPQRDGPALRATTLIAYANWLRANSNTTHVQNVLWPIISLDLNYVSNNWNSTTFDLWEEVSGASFFTTAAQHRALREGIALATALGAPSSTITAWTTQAQNLLCFLQTYWSPESGFIVANVDPINGAIRSGKDANTVLTTIHTFDPAAGCDSSTFQPCSDKALANLKVYVDSFRSIYPINYGIASNAAVATGRYPEDVYYGGNPWYLTTFAVAEQLYRALQVWDAEGKGIEVTSISLPFFQQFNSSATVTTIPAGSASYTTLTNAIKTFADGFALKGAQFVPSSGALAEQYARNDGTPVSAVDLTWSYASVLTMFDAHDRLAVDSWGAAGLTVPTTCSSGDGKSATVIFKETATTIWGENIYLVGNIEALKNWNTNNPIGPLSTTTYPVWTTLVSIPANTHFEYKFIRKFNGTVTWESGANRWNATGAAGTRLTLNNVWK